jgi:hypothetical protein
MPALPPEIENEFLNYIEKFESIDDNSTMVTVYEKIGMPVYSKESNLDDDQLILEIDYVLTILNDCGINVTTNYDVEDREFYRFLTEEFFDHKIYDFIHMDGVMAEFFYEGFHPNIVEDIKSDITDFLDILLNKSESNLLFQFYGQLTEECKTWLRNFSNAYERFEYKSLEIDEFVISDQAKDTKELIVTCEIKFDAFIAGILNPHMFEGEAVARIVLIDDAWQIKNIKLPKPL